MILIGGHAVEMEMPEASLTLRAPRLACPGVDSCVLIIEQAHFELPSSIASYFNQTRHSVFVAVNIPFDDELGLAGNRRSG